MKKYVTLVVLLSLFVTSAWATTTKAGITKADLRALRIIVLEHAVKTGRLPSTEEGISSIPETTGRVPKFDGWGEAFIYRSPSLSVDRLFDLYSKGANRTDDLGQGDDVVYWNNSIYDTRKLNPFDSLPVAIVIFDGPLLILIIGVFYLYRKLRKKWSVSRNNAV